MKLHELTTKSLFTAYHLNDQVSFSCETADPMTLLNSDRLDVMAKVIYLELKDKAPEHARALYLEHIRVMTKDSFVEYDGGKTKKEDFLKSFDALYQDMQEHGYSENGLPIPVDQNGCLMDGAHRAAAAMVLQIPVRIVKIDVDAEYDHYDYRYFREHAMNEDYLDEMVLRYTELDPEVGCVNLWPSAKGHDPEAEKILEDRFGIFYKKEVTLNENGAFNYLAQIYREYSWAKNDGDGFSGVYRKLVPCFPTFDPIRVYLIHVKDFSKVTEVKEELRSIYQLEKHSLHATDNHQETVDMARLLLSSNSIFFMNHCNSTAFHSTFRLLAEAQKMNLSETVFTGSIVLALYGIREADDLDYLTLNQNDPDSHDKYISLYGMTLNDAIYNPENWFTYFGMRFLTLERVRKFKEARKESKDRDDLKLIDLVLSEKNQTNYKVKLLQWKRRTAAKVQGAILRAAHKTGTYDALRSLYKKLKGNRS